MKRATNDLSRSPTMPVPLAFPLGLIPTAAHSTLMASFLNRLFAPELADGELDFLADRVMLIRVSDARIQVRLTLEQGRLKAVSSNRAEDLSIEGSVYDFLLLATRREDADTLFFNRRLRLGGSTELGLYVKNFLDGVELEGRLGPLLKVMNGATSFIGRFGR
ncbi:SCP2 sterol-binding domain-containing protein [Thioalkalicoccus limnaeus]|uniref:Ubiquinone biosynthesis accessory factor UbiT n=1 Tax=Thioalkalicoccus limnaeus TaxID=120681 RepID=A0ABV4BEQ2_9GAMM